MTHKVKIEDFEGLEREVELAGSTKEKKTLAFYFTIHSQLWIVRHQGRRIFMSDNLKDAVDVYNSKE